MAAQLEEELDRLDAALAAPSRKLEQLPGTAEPLATALATASASFSYDAESSLTGGHYLKELLAAAAKGLVLVERDKRITAFPLLLKLEPSIPAVRVGRKLERQMRPNVEGIASVVMQTTRRANGAGTAAVYAERWHTASMLCPSGSRMNAP